VSICERGASCSNGTRDEPTRHRLCLDFLTVVPDPSEEHKPENKADRLKSLRKKLSKLNRAPLPEPPQAERPPRPTPSAAERQPGAYPRGSIVYHRDLPRVEPRRVAHGGICIPLEQCVEGSQAQSAHGPPFYLIERSVADAEPEASGLPATLARALSTLAQRETPEGEEPLMVAPGDICFLDIETTGLGCTPIFLIGTLVWRDGDIVCRQFLARTYAEELSILSHFAQEAHAARVFVSFNGKTFDIPFLRVRAAATGAAFHEPKLHFDLLHEARRHFRNRLPDCKLKTLERYVCQRHRGDDIDGSDIARAYHDFVRTGDAREIARIVQHNQWDLVTMVHLMAKMLLMPDA